MEKRSARCLYLRELSSLEQDADCIVREYYNIAEYEDGTATADTVLFDIAKHRNVATDEVIAGYSMQCGVFIDLVLCNNSLGFF